MYDKNDQNRARMRHGQLVGLSTHEDRYKNNKILLNKIVESSLNCSMNNLRRFTWIR